MYALNEREEKVIGRFVDNQSKYEDAEMWLKWKDGSQVVAKYRMYLEDVNDCEPEDEKYEEFWSFVFEVTDVKGTPPVHITHHNLFIVSYHNFPDEIVVDGKKIN